MWTSAVNRDRDGAIILIAASSEEFNKARGADRLANEINDLAQTRILGRAEPLEHHHFSSNDLGAVALQASDRRLFAFGAA
jgi:hypothetical protein